MLKILFLILSFSFIQAKSAGQQEKIPVVISHGMAASKFRPTLIYTAGNAELLSNFYNKNSSYFLNKKYLFNKKNHQVLSFNYHDVFIDLGPQGSIPHIFHTTPAQSTDIQELKKQLDSLTQEKIIGFGHSRGAATWLTTLGKYPLENRIALLILEAPFSQAKNGIFYSFLTKLTSGIKKIINSIDSTQWCDWFFTSIFWFYNLNEEQPINTIAQIPLSIPILIVHSKEDQIIPINDARELYKELRLTGHDAYLFECPRGDHSLILEYDDLDEYIFLVHELYKKYGLPYDERYVNKLSGLEIYKPEIQEIDERMQKQNKEHHYIIYDQIEYPEKHSFSFVLNL